jgi:hypothetical protein
VEGGTLGEVVGEELGLRVGAALGDPGGTVGVMVAGAVEEVAERVGSEIVAVGEVVASTGSEGDGVAGAWEVQPTKPITAATPRLRRPRRIPMTHSVEAPHA